jgi:3-hydroxybutyryl-CoA dehydratase
MDSPCREMLYSNIAEGDIASFSMVVDAATVERFSELSGDKNPLHMDDSYARSAAPGGQRIAHGMIVGAFFSKLVGMYLPGKHALYLSQTLRFQYPIVLGTEAVIKGEVTHKSDAHRIITIHTTATDKGTGILLVNGEALVQLLQ